jgi:hypothetical protein
MMPILIKEFGGQVILALSYAHEMILVSIRTLPYPSKCERKQIEPTPTNC